MDEKTPSYVKMDEWSLGGGEFLSDTLGTDPFKPFDFQLSTHGSRHTDTFTVEPIFAFVATNHESIIVRLPTHAPQPVRIVFILIRIKAVATHNVIEIIVVVVIIY